MNNDNTEKKKLKRGQRPEGWKNDCAKFKEYYAIRNPNWTEEQCVDAAKKFNKRNNYRSIEYWEYRYPNATHEEHLEMRKNMIEEAKSNHPQNVSYWEKKFPDATHEEHLKMVEHFNKENNSQCIEFYEKRFPDATHEEHLKMLNASIKNRIEVRPDLSGENNGMHRSNTTDLERRQISPKCIEFYQKKYPEKTLEECQQMVDEHINGVRTIMKDKTKQVKCIEYWLAKGYTKKEAVKIISESQLTFTLDKCIEKYGLEEGTKRYNERQNKWLKSFKNSLKSQFVNGIQSSGIANELFNIIETQIKGQKEFVLGKYVFDFVYEHKIIEFNGDYWHANPKIYDKTFINKTNGHTAKEIWSHDKSKIKYAQKHGYEVYTVWESDFRNDPNNVIKKCMDFLTQ